MPNEMECWFFTRLKSQELVFYVTTLDVFGVTEVNLKLGIRQQNQHQISGMHNDCSPIPLQPYYAYCDGDSTVGYPKLLHFHGNYT